MRMRKEIRHEMKVDTIEFTDCFNVGCEEKRVRMHLRILA
jgi:hypothetical protein